MSRRESVRSVSSDSSEWQDSLDEQISRANAAPLTIAGEDSEPRTLCFRDGRSTADVLDVREIQWKTV